MKTLLINIIRIVCFVLTLYFWKYVLDTKVSQPIAYAVAIVPILLVFVASWRARKILEPEIQWFYARLLCFSQPACISSR